MYMSVYTYIMHMHVYIYDVFEGNFFLPYICFWLFAFIFLCLSVWLNMFLTLIFEGSFMCFYFITSRIYFSLPFPPQPPVVKTEMVTISDASQRTEISTKEVPIVQTETKTITYEAPQV